MEINSKSSEKVTPVNVISTPIKSSPEVLMKIRKTSESEIVDIENITEFPIDDEITKEIEKPLSLSLSAEITPIVHDNGKDAVVDADEQEKIEKPIKAPSPITVQQSEEEINDIQLRRNIAVTRSETLSTSVPTQRSLWPLAATPPITRGSLNFSDMLTQNLCREHDFNIRHSMSTSSAMRQKENDTFAMIRGASSCSKDTLMFIDQQGHCLIDDDSSHFGNKPLWVCVSIFHLKTKPSIILIFLLGG